MLPGPRLDPSGQALGFNTIGNRIFAKTCPLHSDEEWRSLKRDTPELFDRACRLEALLNPRRRSLGKDEVWLTRHGRPLAEVVDDQLTLGGTGNDGCDSGWCLT